MVKKSDICPLKGYKIKVLIIHIISLELLWHGSRTENYVGILSEGLRIATPDAPVSGYMFGKGLYFADVPSKSANYCYPKEE